MILIVREHKQVVIYKILQQTCFEPISFVPFNRAGSLSGEELNYEFVILTAALFLLWICAVSFKKCVNCLVTALGVKLARFCWLLDKQPEGPNRIRSI